MAKKVESIKHKGNTRPHIPSKEEAGYEDANEKVTEGKKILELPKNPVVHRGQDPELFWLNKYGNDDRDDLLRVDIRSLYRHEHIAPETLIKYLYKLVEDEKLKTTNQQLDIFSVNELFGNALEKDEIEKVSEYYHHQDGWTNRLIQGDSHLVMASLLEREGMAGQVQTIYFDPPYGIKYGGNWQIKLNNRDVKDGNDEALTGEPEQIKAFRDTWELGIHSYLSYLRDRLLIAKELLTESGSCFVQISDENVHLVRSVMDEVFGSENFCSQITFTKSTGLKSKGLPARCDYIIWYSKSIEKTKYRQLFEIKTIGDSGATQYDWIHKANGEKRKLKENDNIEKGDRLFHIGDASAMSNSSEGAIGIEINGRLIMPPKGRLWQSNIEGMNTLLKKGRLMLVGNSLRYIRYFDDFPVFPIDSLWTDTGISGFGESKKYVVQTLAKVLQRCILMTTDPGDLVLDPTCGSGTTAYVAEQWGRRWITIDTSRIAINIAKQRLMTAVFPYYKLYDEEVFSSQFSVSSEETKHSELKTKNSELKTKHSELKTTHSELKTKNFPDIRQGFKYKTVPHITLKSLANDEPPATETLYDQPETDNKKLRVSGPFTVETLQNFEPIPVDSDEWLVDSEDNGKFEEVIKQHLISAGIKNGRKDEMVVFRSVELLAGEALHAEGFYQNGVGEKKAYFHIGPKFGTVSKKLVNDAIKECRQKGDANWLIILGFSFESDIEGGTQTTSMGNFEVTKVRIHDDLLQEGLKKKPAKSAASFVTIGEPDIEVFSEEFLVFSNEVKVNYGEIKKLSGLNSLAEINGLSQTDLYLYAILSEGRNVWHYLANAEGFHFHSGKHSGGAGKEQPEGVPSISWDSPRLSSGVGNLLDSLGEFGIHSAADIKGIVDQLRGDQQFISRIEKIAANLNLMLPPKNQPLITKNYALTTIKGLDIYDPIKDEVKARNIHDIAYWMVDDDYDGSNFVVKQVFFCGGEKDAFTKWKKGLDNLAKDSTKKKVEKTLKIEIDDEAFDRLYGHISHPIEINKKGQKIAVRIVSQFGEECTKVLTVG